jgi:hypothetical protein
LLPPVIPQSRVASSPKEPGSEPGELVDEFWSTMNLEVHIECTQIDGKQVGNTGTVAEDAALVVNGLQ